MDPTTPDGLPEASVTPVQGSPAATEAAPTPSPEGGSSTPNEPAFVVPPTPVAPPRRRWRPIVVPVAAFLVAILAGGGLFVGGYALGSQKAATPGTAADLQQEFQPFWEAWNAITQQYAGGPVDHHALIEGAIGGLFTALNDPYSGYMTSEAYKQSLSSVTGQFEGIGAEIGSQAKDGSGNCTPLSATCQMVVISPIDGSPAQKAGLEAGDIITAIDGTSVDGLTLDDAVNKVRGPRGTQVALTIQRSGSAAPIQLQITRDVIVVKDVTSKTLENGTVGYIKIAHFSTNVGADFRTALKAFLDQGIKSYVLDLRGDPGGFVPDAVSVASEFLGPDKVVFWEEYAGGTQQETKADSDGLATDPSIKLVVLVDKGSASASEIVAAALKENGRAQLVGTTTYGKGTVQEWQLLSGDTGGFRLTIAKWLTPDKNWVHNTGVAPDIAVSADGAASGTDPILARALEVLGSMSADAVFDHVF